MFSILKVQNSFYCDTNNENRSIAPLESVLWHTWLCVSRLGVKWCVSSVLCHLYWLLWCVYYYLLLHDHLCVAMGVAWTAAPDRTHESIASTWYMNVAGWWVLKSQRPPPFGRETRTEDDGLKRTRTNGAVTGGADTSTPPSLGDNGIKIPEYTIDTD